MSAETELIERYLVELTRWAGRTNLVGSTAREALERHVSDSLAVAGQLPRAVRVVDLGSGAGFPGIPLAIARPDLQLTLIEIRERRVHFLRHVVRSLELGCEVERRRIEEPLPEPFDHVLMRAVAPPVVAHRMARPWVARGGAIWIWTGPGPEVAGMGSAQSIPLRSGGAILQLSPP